MNNLNFDTNVNSSERGSRLVLSAALIGSVLVAPESVSVVLALIALYPAFTALMAWDPVYAVFALRSRGLQDRNTKRTSMNTKAMA